MTIEEIRANAPYGATTYVENNELVYYLRFKNNRWEVFFNYDSHKGWGLANQYAITTHIDKLKPL